MTDVFQILHSRNPNQTIDLVSPDFQPKSLPYPLHLATPISRFVSKNTISSLSGWLGEKKLIGNIYLSYVSTVEDFSVVRIWVYEIIKTEGPTLFDRFVEDIDPLLSSSSTKLSHDRRRAAKIFGECVRSPNTARSLEEALIDNGFAINPRKRRKFEQLISIQ
jgi:hypothetical protein